MMSVTTMDIKKGDTAPALAITCTVQDTPSSAKVPVVLTGATCVVTGKRGTTVVFTDNAPTIAGNVITHQWVAGETDTVGDIKIEAVVTYPSGRIQTFPSKDFLNVRVRADLT